MTGAYALEVVIGTPTPCAHSLEKYRTVVQFATA